MAQTIANKQSPDIYRDQKKKKNWYLISMVQAELVRNKFTGLIV